MEWQELQGDDTEDALQTVHSMWELDGPVGISGHFGVVLATQDDGPTRSGSDLLQSVLALSVAGIFHDDHDDWHVFVYECQRSMLQLTSQDAFWVHVGDLLDFQRPL